MAANGWNKSSVSKNVILKAVKLKHLLFYTVKILLYVVYLCNLYYFVTNNNVIELNSIFKQYLKTGHRLQVSFIRFISYTGRVNIKQQLSSFECIYFIFCFVHFECKDGWWNLFQISFLFFLSLCFLCYLSIISCGKMTATLSPPVPPSFPPLIFLCSHFPFCVWYVVCMLL